MPTTQNISAVQTRIEQETMKLRHKTLDSCPWMLSDLVSRHYLTVATITLTLKKLVEIARSGENKTAQMELYSLQQIRLSHIGTFGHEPVWINALRKFEELVADLA